MRTVSGQQARCIRIGDEIVMCMLPNSDGQLELRIEAPEDVAIVRTTSKAKKQTKTQRKA